MLFNIFLFIIFICFSAFFSASETAIFSLGSVKLRRLIEKYPKAKTVKNLLRRPTRLLSAIVFGNLLVNIGLSSFATAIFVKAFGPKGLMLAVFISGTLILFFGEIFPKTFAIHMPEKLSLLFSPALSIFSRIFYPIIIVIEKSVKYFSSLLIQKPKKFKLSDDEFKVALSLSKKGGQISAQQEQMISHVLEFKDTNAGEILTARTDIKGIDSRLTRQEVLETVREEKHSKFPVYQESLDNIVGILYAKDFFLQSDKDYKQILREPIFIPESKGIDDILKLFLEKNENIAIVLDEYGGTEGLITLEDVVEEIFGEIYDEFEIIQEPLEKINEQNYRIFGKTSLKTVNVELKLDLPENQGNIAGFLLSQIERIPQVGERIKYKNVEFMIERATVRRIVSVILKVVSDKD